MTEDKVQDIFHGHTTHLNEREQITVEYVELLIMNPQAVTDELFDRLKQHFSEAEIVEMSFVTGYYNMMHRFNTAIDLEPQNGDNIVVKEHIPQKHFKSDADFGASRERAQR